MPHATGDGGEEHPGHRCVGQPFLTVAPMSVAGGSRLLALLVAVAAAALSNFAASALWVWRVSG